MPEEIFVLSVIAIVASTILIVKLSSQWLTYLNNRSGNAAASGDRLTSTELEEMLTRVVEEGNRPLLQRIEALERSLGASKPAMRLPSPVETVLLDELPPEDERAGPGGSPRRRSLT